MCHRCWRDAGEQYSEKLLCYWAFHRLGSRQILTGWEESQRQSPEPKERDTSGMMDIEILGDETPMEIRRHRAYKDNGIDYCGDLPLHWVRTMK